MTLTRRLVNQGLAVWPLALLGCASTPASEGAALASHRSASGFRNPPGSPERGGDFGDWASFFYRRFTSRSDVALPAGHVLPEGEVRAGLARHNPIDALTWLGHASFVVQLDGQRVLTDPFLTDYASPLAPLGPRRFAPPALKPERLPRIDVLLLSHNHYDHLDLPSIEALGGKDRLQVIVPLGLGHYFTARGYSHVQEVDWHESVTVGALEITALPAIHFSRRTPFDTNQTLWCGYAIQSRARRVYFAGDSAYGPIFPELGRGLAPFDVALVPIGAYEPRVLMRASHATPEEALQIADDLRAGCVVAMHWGTIELTDEPPFEPARRFRAAAQAAGRSDAAAWLMRIGETRAI